MLLVHQHLKFSAFFLQYLMIMQEWRIRWKEESFSSSSPGVHHLEICIDLCVWRREGGRVVVWFSLKQTELGFIFIATKRSKRLCEREKSPGRLKLQTSHFKECHLIRVAAKHTNQIWGLSYRGTFQRLASNLWDSSDHLLRSNFPCIDISALCSCWVPCTALQWCRSKRKVDALEEPPPHSKRT